GPSMLKLTYMSSSPSSFPTSDVPLADESCRTRGKCWQIVDLTGTSGFDTLVISHREIPRRCDYLHTYAGIRRQYVGNNAQAQDEEARRRGRGRRGRGARGARGRTRRTRGTRRRGRRRGDRGRGGGRGRGRRGGRAEGQAQDLEGQD